MLESENDKNNRLKNECKLPRNKLFDVCVYLLRDEMAASLDSPTGISVRH
jgi:hypothetical protein